MNNPASSVSLSVSGMQCEGCVNAVKRLVLRQDSGARVEIDLQAARATIHSDKPATLFAEALTKAGYPAQTH